MRPFNISYSTAHFTTTSEPDYCQLNQIYYTTRYTDPPHNCNEQPPTICQQCTDVTRLSGGTNKGKVITCSSSTIRWFSSFSTFCCTATIAELSSPAPSTRLEPSLSRFSVSVIRSDSCSLMVCGQTRIVAILRYRLDKFMKNETVVF